MFKVKANRRYAMSAVISVPFAKRGEGDGGDGGSDTFSKDEMASAIAAAVAKANDESTAKNKSSREGILSDLKKAKEFAKQFNGVDLERFNKMSVAFENDQDLKDIADGKFTEVMDRRLEKERAENSSKINSANEERDGYKVENVKLVDRVSKLLIDNSVVSEFNKEKGLVTAVADVVNRANSVFKVEGEDLIPRDLNGDIMVGKDGTLSIQEWVGALKESAPHLFPGSSDGNPGGGDSKKVGDSNTLAAKISDAAGRGDMREYRRLRDQQLNPKTAK